MSFNEKYEILEIVYSGDISFDDMISLGEKIRDNINLPRELKMLTDATKASYNFTPDKIPIINQKIKNDIKNYISVKAAFLQSRPTETAMSVVFEEQNEVEKYNHRIFSTREAALQWLLNDI